RFNIAILDNGNYLPSGQYLLIYKGRFEYIAQINNNLTDLDNYELDEEQLNKYLDLETSNDKKNYLLNYFKYTFKKGGNSKKTIYTVFPKISKEVNEFVLQITFNKPKPKPNKIKEKIKTIKNKYNRRMFKIRKFLFKSIFNITKFLHLRKGNTVLFTSDSREEMSGNFDFVYNEMLRQNLEEKYKIHQIFKPNIAARRNFIDKFRFPYLLGKADYIFVDDFHPLLYTVKFRKSQEIIQLWHAVGAFKTVGFSRTGKKGGPFFDSVNHRNYTKAFVSSENDVPFYGEAFGIKEQNIIPTGVPRTDFTRLAHYCKENNAVVLFKMHPFVKNTLNIPEQYKNYFVDISDFREVNDILFITNILISDYSSLVYEFAVFKRPMLFYAFDLEDYITSRDFYEPYQNFVPGKIVETFSDLIESLYNNDFEEEKIPGFLDKHFKYTDGKSSERVVRRIFGA